MWRHTLITLSLALTPTLAPNWALAERCHLDFTVEITQGVGPFRPGDRVAGQADYDTTGQTIRQEGGSVAHLARGEMRLGPDIRGEIWTLIVTSRGAAADLIGVYARNVTGLNFAGVAFEGPMALTLFGTPGTRSDAGPPRGQEDWDEMHLRRAFSLHAHAVDMLAGDVVALSARCGIPAPIDSAAESAYPAAQ